MLAFTFLVIGAVAVTVLTPVVVYLIERQRIRQEQEMRTVEALAELPPQKIVGLRGRVNMAYDPLAYDEDVFVPVRDNVVPFKKASDES